MGKAAYLVANGKTIEEAAAGIGVRPSNIRDWQTRWKETWHILIDKAAESLVDSIRAMAGTSAVLSDPTAFQARTAFVDDWARQKGTDIFPASDGEMTLCRFFEEWYLPQKLFDAKESAKQCYRTALNAWRSLIGDPPVKQITPLMLALFRDARLKTRSVITGKTLSPNGVRTNLRLIQILLDKMGAPGRGNRDAQGILDRVPWAQPPREEIKIPRTITLQQLSACYRAAASMREPRVPGIDPSAWWRAMLIIAWNTGLRRGTLFAMRWSDVDWAGHRLVLPAAQMKSRRPMIVHLNSVAIEALHSIKTNRELIFPWTPMTSWKRRFSQMFHVLQDKAGIPSSEHFGLHIIRKTLATTLYETNPGLPQRIENRSPHLCDGESSIPVNSWRPDSRDSKWPTSWASEFATSRITNRGTESFGGTPCERP